MRKFIVSDLHIGHPQAQYDVMDEAVKYIWRMRRMETVSGDWGIGSTLMRWGWTCV